MWCAILIRRQHKMLTKTLIYISLNISIFSSINDIFFFIFWVAWLTFFFLNKVFFFNMHKMKIIFIFLWVFCVWVVVNFFLIWLIDSHIIINFPTKFAKWTKVDVTRDPPLTIFFFFFKKRQEKREKKQKVRAASEKLLKWRPH